MTVKEKALVSDLVNALKGMLKAYEQLMPGLAHIAVQDYANINEAPIMARKAIAAISER